MLARGYKSVAIVFLNFLILLLVANVACSLYMGWGRPEFGPLSVYPLSLTMKAYPGWSEHDVQQLLRETYYDARPRYDLIPQIKERATSGRFVNVDPAGFRKVRDQGPWPPDPSAENIFLFGGSTTFGYGVPDADTIASHLQDLVASKKPAVHVYNFGRAAYTSTQEMLLFLSLVRSGYVPNVAIFIDGINDCSSTWRPDGWFYGELIAGRVEQSDWGNALSLLGDLALVKLVKARIPNPAPASADQISPQNIGSFVIENYQKNQRMIRGICSLYGTRALFVWQPIVLYKYDVSRHFMAGDKKYGYFQKMPGAAQAISIYQRVEQLAAVNSLGDGFVFMADIAEDQDRNRYVDVNHYNGEFSAVIATHILSALRNQHLLQ
jgi:hypothetical protein